MRKSIVVLLIIFGIIPSVFSQQVNHDIWTTVLKENVDNNGHVNYKNLKQHPQNLNTYLDLLSKSNPNSSWSKNETLAFWINAYNAFTIKLIIDHYPISSIKDISKPWDTPFISINNTSYSLGDVEHNILRTINKPQIHFAIVCASVSCPKLLNEAYTATHLNAQLDTAAVNFINSDKNQLTAGTIKLSKIFKWFSKDFKTKGSLIQFINTYAKHPINADEHIGYLSYNWDLNE
ncbi:DUF547 domain-containing protein [Formosa haliotis]|uniref:DUF547 domain-containing protein n=1 Tax=Formosa haliotis TaxID=1555194 RepID=UPI0008271996|nr:DUF547 domain-containing protein [Formosa haliotis]